MLKVASYNIHKGVGTDRRRNPERILGVLGEIDADVVALQEADMRFGLRPAVLSPHLLDGHSDYRAVPLDVRSDSMGWHGNVLLVRKSATVLAHDILRIPCLEPRGAIMARVATGDMELAVFGMHLDLSGLWRRKQASAIAQAAAELSVDVPTVVMGDLNEWSARGGCLRDFARGLAFADCGPSFHARRPVARLDRIMHSPALRVVESGAHASALARRASDHLPVWAVLERV